MNREVGGFVIIFAHLRIRIQLGLFPKKKEPEISAWRKAEGRSKADSSFFLIDVKLQDKGRTDHISERFI
jgi:hypothetical protein